MIQLVLVPLIAVGVAGALWREYQKSKKHTVQLQDLSDETDTVLQKSESKSKSKSKAKLTEKIFDDVDELNHYQRVSWYAFALSLSGRWFFPPIALLSLPLLSYNAYHFMKTFQQLNLQEKKSAMSVFEILSFSTTFILGNVVMASTLLLFSFGFRKLLLHAGNIAHSGLLPNVNPKNIKTWILREGVEIEVTISELQEGDIIVIHSGDVILTTGKVFQGEGIVTQYSLKKRLKEIPKKTGDNVYPFTRLISGNLYIRYSPFS